MATKAFTFAVCVCMCVCVCVCVRTQASVCTSVRVCHLLGCLYSGTSHTEMYIQVELVVY